MRGVHGERRARGCRHAQALHQHLRAVVAGAHADAVASEDLGDVVRVDVREGERREAAAVLQLHRAVQRELRDGAQPLMRRLGVPASSRASFAVHNTHEDVDRLIEGLARVREVFA